ncbi:serine carboxypeptidase-like 32 isoform X3 [Apium graveolens]|uniref:serine carboxypeptidase-like 32 isoform X3 n=1 Tax=Apium graveolens TaxID=4045 RepID=UPI003D795419
MNSILMISFTIIYFSVLSVSHVSGARHDFQHYAGYVTVNENNGRALFYWFYEALTFPDDKPLVLWLNGGPGCSSVGYGATQELGPFIVDGHARELKFNPYSWTRGARHGQFPTTQMNSISGDDLVTNLPGQPNIDFQHYAGYVTVNENNGRALFYWFYEALTFPDDKPLVLWLNGGPGCSSVGYGATQELGPFIVDGHARELKFNPYSWTRGARHGQFPTTQMNSISGDDLVTNLPGQPNIDFQHYAGYVTVNENNGRALFYWFYEALTFPDDKPLVLWLNGGPGCSSVGYGATQELGPFIVDGHARELKFNPYSWTREANMLFLESPVGVGFSYSNTSSDYRKLGDDFTANDAYAFLQKWFLKFPSYRKRILYIAGESYAGRYVPDLAALIQNKNKDSFGHINLRGILLGNPETCYADDWQGILDYAWSHAIVSEETHKTIKESCDMYSGNQWSDDCSQAAEEVYRQYKEIDMYSLYTSGCIGNTAGSEYNSNQVMVRGKSNMMPGILGGYDPCLDDYAKTYYNRPDVQKALHVSDGHLLKNWSICNMDVYNNWLWSESKESVLPIYKDLIAAGLKIWVYSGDTDGRLPVLSTRYSINSLGLPIIRAWRPWYHQKQVAGWVQEYKGLAFATFRGAGHAVPLFKPSESLAFFAAFINGRISALI